MSEPPCPCCRLHSTSDSATPVAGLRRAHGITWLVAVLLVSFSLPGCTPIRPVEKVGLLAPFEGLYRRTGYAALAAMRAALAAAPRARVDRLPLALDTSRDPVRTTQKLLADSSVRAVIGPLSLATAGSIQEVLAKSPVLWLAPFAIDANGSFAPVNQPERWVQPWLGAMAQAARQQGYSRLVVAGWPAVWSQPAFESAAGFIVLSDDPAIVQPGDAVLHAGDAATVAGYLHALRARQPNVPLYLGFQGEDPVFKEHSQITDEVYWMVWLDDSYEAWTAEHGIESPLRYLVYRATITAIQVANGESPAGGLRIHWYAFDENGHWRAVREPVSVSAWRQ